MRILENGRHGYPIRRVADGIRTLSRTFSENTTLCNLAFVDGVREEPVRWAMELTRRQYVHLMTNMLNYCQGITHRQTDDYR
jgi:hypothetical protein